jgi:hypothetical protein
MKLTLPLVLAAMALVACSTPPAPPAPAPLPVIPPNGLVPDEIAGQPRLFSTFGFVMLDAPLKARLQASFNADGRLNPALLRQNLPEAQIVASPRTTAVMLPSGTFTFLLLRDGPLISLDPSFDGMVQQLSNRLSPSR